MGQIVADALPQHSDTSFFGHPRGLATLFFTEMWERYSYYGTRALLILYMTAGVQTGGLNFSVMKVGRNLRFLTSMVYLSSLPADGWHDRVLGQQRAVLLGGILIAAEISVWPRQYDRLLWRVGSAYCWGPVIKAKCQYHRRTTLSAG